jgi:hypothetical protein
MAAGSTYDVSTMKEPCRLEGKKAIVSKLPNSYNGNGRCYYLPYGWRFRVDWYEVGICRDEAPGLGNAETAKDGYCAEPKLRPLQSQTTWLLCKDFSIIYPLVKSSK